MRSARNVEDIKARFYSIMRKLLEERNLLESTPENILFCRPFDKSYVSRTIAFHSLLHRLVIYNCNRYELERKRQLETIFARDPSVAIQEEKLMEEARKIQALLKKKNEEMRRHLMEQSTADQDRLRRQNINARLLQPGSVSLRSSLIHSMCAESSGHPRVDAKVCSCAGFMFHFVLVFNPGERRDQRASLRQSDGDGCVLSHLHGLEERRQTLGALAGRTGTQALRVRPPLPTLTSSLTQLCRYEKLRARRADLMRSMKKGKTPGSLNFKILNHALLSPC